MSDKPIAPAAPALYATMLPGLQEVARAHGYALAVHGSMARDFDLIAVPWTSSAGAPHEVARALCDRVGGSFSQFDSNGVAGSKPHGRRCWSIHFGGGCYIDLSIMPRLTHDFEITEPNRIVLSHLREFPEDAPARPPEGA